MQLVMRGFVYRGLLICVLFLACSGQAFSGVCPFDPGADPADADADGIADVCDNCIIAHCLPLYIHHQQVNACSRPIGAPLSPLLLS